MKGLPAGAPGSVPYGTVGPLIPRTVCRAVCRSGTIIIFNYPGEHPPLRAHRPAWFRRVAPGGTHGDGRTVKLAARPEPFEKNLFFKTFFNFEFFLFLLNVFVPPPTDFKKCGIVKLIGFSRLGEWYKL